MSCRVFYFYSFSFAQTRVSSKTPVDRLSSDKQISPFFQAFSISCFGRLLWHPFRTDSLSLLPSSWVFFLAERFRARFRLRLCVCRWPPVGVLSSFFHGAFHSLPLVAPVEIPPSFFLTSSPFPRGGASFESPPSPFGSIVKSTFSPRGLDFAKSFPPFSCYPARFFSRRSSRAEGMGQCSD